MNSLRLYLFAVPGILFLTSFITWFILRSFSSRKCLFFGVVALMSVNPAGAVDVFMPWGHLRLLAHGTAVTKPAAPFPGS